MDQALLLRQAYDSKTTLSNELIDEWLSQSELVKNLTSDFSVKGLFPIWRLLALAEIPFTIRLPYTQKLIKYCEQTYATPEGFSITGKAEDILPCYNAMLLEAYAKLGLTDHASAGAALNWIKQYQTFGRGEETSWHGKGIKKYGGCLKETPCFIGIAKSVKALVYYQRHSLNVTDELDALIQKGVAYLLKHNLFQRLSDHMPITKHILDIAYPQSYQLNLYELLDIVHQTGHLYDPRVEPALTYIKDKMSPNQDWKINYIYKADGYVSFDRKGTTGEWISYVLDNILEAYDETQIENHTQ